MRLLGYASPDGKRGEARGNTDKNVGRVQPVEPSRRRILVFPTTFIWNTRAINFILRKTSKRSLEEAKRIPGTSPLALTEIPIIWHIAQHG